MRELSLLPISRPQAELHSHYASLDVPQSVVFPFLHGVDGTNLAQNVFFKTPISGQPAPNYRGLAIVRADMPTPTQQRRQHRASFAASSSNHSRSRAHSIASSSAGSEDASRASSEGGRHEMAPSSSVTSINSSVASSDRSSASLFSAANDSGYNTSQTSVTTSCGAEEAQQKQPHQAASPTESWDPQPEHSILNSSFYPAELLRPPVMVNRRSKKSYHAVPCSSPTQDETMVQTSSFYRPEQPDGVNLRNFKIQSAKYATVSDIVIYCPAGFHEGVLCLAKWFQEAHEASWQERVDRGLGGLRYNVFIVTEPFAAFQRIAPHLVAVNAHGTPQHRVDFVEREREEMQRLTAASPIDDNVWLGCTGDMPAFDDEDGDADDLSDAENRQLNPHGFSICIECHDSADVPDARRLSHAAHFLDAVEATAVFELNSKQALRDFEQDEGTDGSRGRSEARGRVVDGSDDSRASSLSLGPNGWTPALPSRLQSGGLRRKTSEGPSEGVAKALTPAVNNIVQLECSSLSGLLPDREQDRLPGTEVDRQLSRVADAVVNVCVWLKNQSVPAATQAASQPQPSSGGLLAGALRSVGNHHGRHSGSQSPSSPKQARSVLPSTPTAKRHPRRVLIHCGDGYTESSILALTYLMYARGLSLPDAYLHLQNTAKRSFFVFAKDVPLLKKLEIHAMAMRRREAEQFEAAQEAAQSRTAKAKHSFPWLNSDEKEARRKAGASPSGRRGSMTSSEQPHEQGSMWARGLHGLVSAASGGSSTLKKTPSSAALGTNLSPTTSNTGGSTSPRSEIAPPSRALTPTPRSVRQKQTDHSWFHDPRFEGSFPSRILPFLYLGNLNHALNPAMLHALGISHVVSVGESALHPPTSSSTTVASTTGGGPAPKLPAVPEPEVRNSLWNEEQAGRISVLDLKNVSDDGIDPLRSTMRRAVEYIEAARRKGERVLVHCRVGVSRSTTIVLAYVMAHLDLTLVESYLLVRSRRLSILIQPHLLFFWELRGWETYVASQKLKRAAEDAMRQAGVQLDEADLKRKPALSALSLETRLDDVVNPTNAAAIASQAAKVGSSCGFQHARTASTASNIKADGEQGSDLDVDIGLGAGSPYGFQVSDVHKRPFGSGSPSGIPAESLRLTWGFLCREIAALNERYF